MDCKAAPSVLCITNSCSGATHLHLPLITQQYQINGERGLVGLGLQETCCSLWGTSPFLHPVFGGQRGRSSSRSLAGRPCPTVDDSPPVIPFLPHPTPLIEQQDLLPLGKMLCPPGKVQDAWGRLVYQDALCLGNC